MIDIAQLVANKSKIAAEKVQQLKYTKGMPSQPVRLMATKALNDDSDTVIERSIVLNTYNWMDSHDDVHLDNVFEECLKTDKEHIAHLHDHIYNLTAKVGKPIDVYEEKIAWQDLGVDKEGETMALIMDSAIQQKLNAQIFEMYKDGEINQHSVGMRYGHIELAVGDPRYEEEYSVWLAHIDKIGNKEAAMAQNYFWAVHSAKVFEGSAVIAGSNELTPTREKILDHLPNATEQVENQESKTNSQKAAMLQTKFNYLKTKC